MPTADACRRHGAGCRASACGACSPIARRESLELLRDRVRLGFALLGTMLLMLVFGYGITMDVENLSLRGARPRPHAGEPRLRPGIRRLALLRRASADRRRRRRSSGACAAASWPGDRDPARLRPRPRCAAAPAEVGAWIDGAMPFRAETVRGYVQGVHQDFLASWPRRTGPPAAPVADARDRGSATTRTSRASTPWCPAPSPILLVFIPAILTALGVVREKELGSITNLYVTPYPALRIPARQAAALYRAIAMLNFVLLVAGRARCSACRSRAAWRR